MTVETKSPVESMFSLAWPDTANMPRFGAQDEALRGAYWRCLIALDDADAPETVLIQAVDADSTPLGSVSLPAGALAEFARRLRELAPDWDWSAPDAGA